MSKSSMTAAAAATLMLALHGSPLFAARDNTLGMALMFAVVNADGTLARGSGVVSSARTATGGYEVIFDRDVTACVFTATLGPADTSVTSAGEINVSSRAGKANGAWVDTRDSSGTFSDTSFHLLAYCAR